MQSELLLHIYRLSGWAVILSILLVCQAVIKNKAAWRQPYSLLSSYFCIIFILEIVTATQSIFRHNTHYISFIYIALEFSLLLFYLGSVTGRRSAVILSYFIAAIFICFQLYQAFDNNAHQNYDAIGIFINTFILIVYAFVVLSLLFRRNPQQNLRRSPDFWFTSTIFCLNCTDLLIFILTTVTYDAMSESAFLSLHIGRNLLKSGFLYGYYRGIKLLR